MAGNPFDSGLELGETMKIKEYPHATEYSDTDAFIIETSDGTKYIEGSELPFGNKLTPSESINLETTNVSTSNSISSYLEKSSAKGQTLGSYRYISFTFKVLKAIPAGTFMNNVFSVKYTGDVYWDPFAPYVPGISSSGLGMVIGSFSMSKSLALYFPQGYESGYVNMYFGPYYCNR